MNSSLILLAVLFQKFGSLVYDIHVLQIFFVLLIYTYPINDDSVMKVELTLSYEVTNVVMSVKELIVGP